MFNEIVNAGFCFPELRFYARRIRKNNAIVFASGRDIKERGDSSAESRLCRFHSPSPCKSMKPKLRSGMSPGFRTAAVFISVMFLLIAYSHGMETISLCGVPWTDAAYFWTYNGRRLPVKNKNLFGHSIKIAGVKYKKGLAGHTCFSVVYNLSRQAVRFTAYAGIDDEIHPKDKTHSDKETWVRVVIFVDRKKVFSRKVYYGRAPVKIDISLKDKYQIELRGEYGENFTMQRIVFAEPELYVYDKKEFLREAEQWAAKVKKEKMCSPLYPETPKWQNIKIKKITYGQKWKNAWEVSNGTYKLVILPEFGGRIVEFSRINGENIFSETEKFNTENIMKRGFNILYGGHFMRPQPKNYFLPCDPILLFGKYTVSFPEEGKIIMESPKSFYLFLQYKYIIEIRKNSSEVKITNTQTNIAPFKMKTGVWSITRLRTDILQGIKMPPELSDPPLKSVFGPEKFKKYLKVMPDKSFFFPVSLSLKNQLVKRTAVEWQEFPKYNIIEAEMRNCIFRKRFILNKKTIKDMSTVVYPAHIYLCKKFLEVEAHSPINETMPGNGTFLTEIWSVNKHFYIKRRDP